MSSVKLVIEGTWDEILAYVDAARRPGTSVEKKTKATTKVAEVASAVSTVQNSQAVSGATPSSLVTKVEEPAHTETPTNPVSFEDIKVLIPQAIAVAGRDAVVNLLAVYKAKKGGDLKLEQYLPFVTAAKKLMDATVKEQIAS